MTGYRDEQPLLRCDNPLSNECRVPIIMRVYESGEVLSPLRRFISWFNPLWPNICEDRYSFGVGGLPVTKHQMRRLAGGMIWKASVAGDAEAKAIYDEYCPAGAATPSDPNTGGPLLECSQPAYPCNAPSGTIRPTN